MLKGRLVPIRELVTVTDTEREQTLYLKERNRGELWWPIWRQLDSGYGMFKMRGELQQLVAPNHLPFKDNHATTR